MDFQQLLARMVELDQPATEAVKATEAPVKECGEPMSMTPPMSSSHDHAPPSLSINLNAQGMDDIESIMKLMTKVNPDMINQPETPAMPTLSIAPPGPTMGPKEPSMADLRNKLLPDLSDEDPVEVDPIEKDGDEDGPEDKDDDEGVMGAALGAMATKSPAGAMAGSDIEDKLKGDDDKEEGFGNAPEGEEPEVKGIDAAIPNGNDLNKPKTMVKHSYRQGDNPMAMTDGDLRASIRAELLQRLEEAKGAK